MNHPTMWSILTFVLLYHLVVRHMNLDAPLFVRGRDVSRPASWRRTKRAILDQHPILCESAWWRRWAGGRWARCNLVLGPCDDPSGCDPSCRGMLAPGADASDAVVTRWRPMEACSCERTCAALLERLPGSWGHLQHSAACCQCEVHP